MFNVVTCPTCNQKFKQGCLKQQITKKNKSPKNKTQPHTHFILFFLFHYNSIILFYFFSIQILYNFINYELINLFSTFETNYYTYRIQWLIKNPCSLHLPHQIEFKNKIILSYNYSCVANVMKNFIIINLSLKLLKNMNSNQFWKKGKKMKIWIIYFHNLWL